MKRLLTSLLIVVLLSVAFSSTVSAEYVGATLVTTKDGTQADAAGFVHIWNDSENIYVKYWMRAGNCLLETHLHLAANLEDIPQGPGGAIPGQFDYKNNHDCVREFTYTIPFADKGFVMGQTIFIAAQAVVLLADGTEETAWGARCGCLEGAQFPGSNWSSYIQFTIN